MESMPTSETPHPGIDDDAFVQDAIEDVNQAGAAGRTFDRHGSILRFLGSAHWLFRRVRSGREGGRRREYHRPLQDRPAHLGILPPSSSSSSSPSSLIAAESFRLVSIDGTTTRASTLSQIDADQRDGHPGVHDDAFVRARSRTSMRLVPPAARSTATALSSLHRDDRSRQDKWVSAEQPWRVERRRGSGLSSRSSAGGSEVHERRLACRPKLSKGHGNPQRGICCLTRICGFGFEPPKCLQDPQPGSDPDQRPNRAEDADPPAKQTRDPTAHNDPASTFAKHSPRRPAWRNRRPRPRLNACA